MKDHNKQVITNNCGREQHTQINWSVLQTIELIESTSDWNVADEMIDFVVFLSCAVIKLKHLLPAQHTTLAHWTFRNDALYKSTLHLLTSLLTTQRPQTTILHVLSPISVVTNGFNNSGLTD